MGPLTFEKKTVEYTQNLFADIHRPNNNKIYPGVILVHGGSWGGRSREDMSRIAELIASHGFVVMNISYRFAPQNRYPAQIEDVDSAMNWFKTNAQELNLNAEKIAGWGYSAGGHLITQWAFLESLKNKKPALKAIVSGGAPYDLSWYPYSPIITHLLDGFRDQRLEEYKAASPTNFVSEWSPPMFLFHAEQDRLVEAVQSSHLQNLLREKGVATELELISFWGHATAFVMGSEAVHKGIEFLAKKMD
jgi:acetyl esterase/lipase